MNGLTTAGRQKPVFAILLAAACAGGGLLAADKPAGDVASFLALREIDQPRRAVIESAAEWSQEAEATLVKVLQRIDAPANLVAGWRAAAAPVPAAGEAVVISDALVVVRGRATFVAPQQLPAELAERLGKASYDVVRIVDDRGLAVDVLTTSAPLSWARWKPIDEPAGVLGLPLSSAAAPRPSGGPADAAPWPEAKPGLVVAAAGVGWYPDTPLGKAGFDYGLFDSVADGQKLVRGDTAAFYAALAAAGRTDPKAIVTAAGGPTDVLRLIDPGRKFFPASRGSPVVIEGAALRATRVAIDDPFRRQEVGSDHYWELYVFVDTPLLDIDGRMQNSFPIVCCVRELSPGMASGDRINEPVRVPGFAFKRYAYTFEAPAEKDGAVVAETEKQQTTLVVGPRAIWTPPAADPASRNIALIAGAAAVAALAAVFGLGLLYGNWSHNRTIQRSRAELPDRVDIRADDVPSDAGPDGR
jgi:hypothetical protein